MNEEILSEGEKFEKLMKDHNLSREDAKLLWKAQHEASRRAMREGYTCHFCGHDKLRYIGKRCNHEFRCIKCGRSDCYYYDGKHFVEGRGWIK
jgi:hypothetical protein